MTFPGMTRNVASSVTKPLSPYRCSPAVVIRASRAFARSAGGCLQGTPGSSRHCWARRKFRIGSSNTAKRGISSLLSTSQQRDTSFTAESVPDCKRMYIVETTYSITYLERLHEPVFNSKSCGSCTRVDAQLVVDGGEVGGDGAVADDELLGHLGVGETLGNQAQHVHLAGGQPCRIGGRLPGGRSGRSLRLPDLD